MRRRWKIAKVGFIYFLVSFLAFLIVAPFILMFVGSFREHTDIVRRGPLALPKQWSLENFRIVLFRHHFERYYMNSLLITAPVVVGSLFLALMAAFAFSVMAFPGKNLILVLVISLGVMVTEVFIMIPLFRLMYLLRLVNNLLSVILPSLAMSACFATLVLRSFFMGLPRELLDSAMVDGANSWQILWRIYAPLATPAIVTSGVLVAVWTWNTYITPLVLIHDPLKIPLPLGLALFQGQYVANVPLIMTGATLTALPPIAVYLFFQPRIVLGILQGSVK